MHFDFFFPPLRTLLLAKQTERETVSRWQPEAQMTNQLPVLPTIPLKSPQQVGKYTLVRTERCLEREGWIVFCVIFVVSVSDFACVPTTDGSVVGEQGAAQASEDQLEEPAVKKQRTEG